jgi:hypothetical protein
VGTKYTTTSNSLSVSKIINILRDGKELDHDTFNMAIRILAKNKYMMLNKQRYHLMDLKFAVSCCI